MAEGTTGAPAKVTEAAAAQNDNDDDDAVLASWLTVDEETSRELSMLLDSFEPSPPPIKVRFIADPYSSAVVFQSSSAYVTINGNEESCGSSFSDSDSSVMASVDLCGARSFLSGGAWGTNADKVREWLEEGSEVDGYLIDDCRGDEEVESWWRNVVGEDEIRSL